MAAFRRFAIALIVVAVATLALILGLARWLAPLKDQELGDLVRIGWYSNNLWGFRKPMVEFADPLYKVSNAYDEYSDIYIVGDSFSIRPRNSWPNYIASAGLSIQVAGAGGAPDRVIEDLVSSPLYKERPPKVVVYATVERAYRWRIERVEPACREGEAARLDVTIDVGPRRALVGHDFLQPTQGNFSEDQITYARDFVVKNLDRALLARSWPVHDFALKETRFSSVKGNYALFISDEHEKRDWTEGDFAHMRCVLRSFQDKVQANGRTFFVSMVIPDKLSIYREDMVDAAVQPESIIPRVDVPGLPATRLDRVLRAAVVRGELDVYLPNDTHWGSSGHRLAAQALLDLLAERGVIPRGGDRPELSGAVAR